MEKCRKPSIGDLTVGEWTAVTFGKLFKDRCDRRGVGHVRLAGPTPSQLLAEELPSIQDDPVAHV